MTADPTESSRHDPVRVIGLCLKPGSPQVDEAVRTLAKWLAERDVEVLLDPAAARALGGRELSRRELGERADFLVVLGGDGTLLSVARQVGTQPVPMVGINLGRLGFLAEIAPGEQFDALERVLRGEYNVTERMRLDVQAFREDRVIASYLALNDAVIARSDPSRMIDLEVNADGARVTTYRADGIIVATPTGSTAYSLSAGGPIVLPSTGAFVLTPISAHTLSQRPVVLPGRTVLEVKVFPREGDAQLTVDGQSHAALQAGDRVQMTASEHPVHFVTSPFRSHFDLLRTKLRWGTD